MGGDQRPFGRGGSASGGGGGQGGEGQGEGDGAGVCGVPRIGNDSLSLLNAVLLIPKTPNFSTCPEPLTKTSGAMFLPATSVAKDASDCACILPVLHLCGALAVW